MLDSHYVPEGYGIVTNFKIGNFVISTYTFFVLLALIIGSVWYFFTMVKKERVNGEKSYLIVLAGLTGGLIGSKIPVIIENIKYISNDISSLKGFVFTGKSIIGGLIGGYVGVRLIKKILKLRHIRSGNLIAPAIALGMAIGRIGCFLTGCCYGIKTNLPIGIDFGDGVKRLPTQVIEIAFCLILFGYLFYKQKYKKNLIPGILFKELVFYYFIFRFLIEFVRGTEKNIFCFSIYQIVCFAGVILIGYKLYMEKYYE